jgi:cholesterol transport system auxiliary component
MRRNSYLCAAGRRPVLMLCLLTIGCGGLLGGGGRADLYRFGVTQEAPAREASVTSPGTARPTLVAFRGATFPSSIDNRILTVSGTSIRYLANSRWAAAAPELFDEALVRGLRRNAAVLRLVQPEQLEVPDFLLLVDVQHFEAQYVGDKKSPPEITIDAHVRLLRRSDRTTIGEWTVTKVEPAHANRVTSIVAAFDQAANSVIRQIADLVGNAVQRQAAL